MPCCAVLCCVVPAHLVRVGKVEASGTRLPKFRRTQEAEEAVSGVNRNVDEQLLRIAPRVDEEMLK